MDNNGHLRFNTNTLESIRHTEVNKKLLIKKDISYRLFLAVSGASNNPDLNPHEAP